MLHPPCELLREAPLCGLSISVGIVPSCKPLRERATPCHYRSAFQRLSPQHSAGSLSHIWTCVHRRDEGALAGPSPSRHCLTSQLRLLTRVSLSWQWVLSLRSAFNAAVLVVLLIIGSATGVAEARPRLTQDEELTVNLFKTNTPSVVFITNLAVRCDMQWRSGKLQSLDVPAGWLAHGSMP
jgi:hypothetical protein